MHSQCELFEETCALNWCIFFLALTAEGDELGRKLDAAYTEVGFALLCWLWCPPPRRHRLLYVVRINRV